MTKMEKLKKRLREYRNSPGSFIIFLLLVLSAIITAGVTFSIIIYVAVKGIPYLDQDMFSLKYTEENQSMLPSIINTIYMTALSLLFAVPIGIGCAIYLVEYAKRRQ